MKKTLWAFICLPLLSFSQQQETGIHFETGLSWEQVKGKAKAENKYIFMDCYATWCGPCKWMSKNIFPEKEVGNYFNSHFICVSVQMDRTPKDDQLVRDWYGDAEMIAKTFSVSAYPTYLFFSSEGQPVHRFSGSSENSQAFLIKSAAALDSSKQYYTLLEQWRSHLGDSAFLWQALSMARDQEDKVHVQSIAEAYLNCQKNLLLLENLQLIYDLRLIRSSKDKWFQLFLDNSNEIDELHKPMDDKKDFAEWALRNVIYGEEIEPLFEKDASINWSRMATHIKNEYPALGDKLIYLLENKNYFPSDLRKSIHRTLAGLDVPEPDWNKIEKDIETKYSGYDCRQIFWEEKANYYYNKKLWSECASAAYILMRKYGRKTTFFDINNEAWNYVFSHCSNVEILQEALKWVERAVKKQPDEDSMDTYANLLYKLGNKKAALEWENKAIEKAIETHASSDNIKICQSNLEKMQMGKPTWEDSMSGS